VKRFLLLLIVALPIVGMAQTVNVIKLNDTLNETRLGLWANGDYKLYINMDELETVYRKAHKFYLDEGTIRFAHDTASSNFYITTAARYQVAANQLQHAENGFNLRNLIVYTGLDNPIENNGSSYEVNRYVTIMVESGNAKVYFKENRVFTLKKQTQFVGHGLGFGAQIRIYYDDSTHCAFQYNQHYGW
jgi:hypothetical protein